MVIKTEGFQRSDKLSVTHYGIHYAIHYGAIKDLTWIFLFGFFIILDEKI